MFRLKRLPLLCLAAAGVLATAAIAEMRPIGRGSVMGAVDRLRAGQYIWMPELAPEGPMLVVVNLATQRLTAYRNGVPIGVSTVSTGKRGHRTPLGVFTVLQKARRHRSNLYSNAPMPYMQRLTWRGIAIHGGPLPGYPASHGCIRLPHGFAKLLFGQTALGMTVAIVDRPAAKLAVGKAPQRLHAPAGERAVWRPELSTEGPVSIVVSGADRRMVVLRNGIEIGSAPVAFDGVVDRVQAYVLADVQDGDYRWQRIALPGQRPARRAAEARMRPVGNPAASDPFHGALAGVVGPGTTMLVVPDPLGFSTPPPPPRIATAEKATVLRAWLRDGQVSAGR